MGKGQILDFIEYDPFQNPNTCTNQHNSQNHIFLDDESSSNIGRQYERVTFDRRTDSRKRIKQYTLYHINPADIKIELTPNICDFQLFQIKRTNRKTLQALTFLILLEYRETIFFIFAILVLRNRIK